MLPIFFGMLIPCRISSRETRNRKEHKVQWVSKFQELLLAESWWTLKHSSAPIKCTTGFLQRHFGRLTLMGTDRQNVDVQRLRVLACVSHTTLKPTAGTDGFVKVRCSIWAFCNAMLDVHLSEGWHITFLTVAYYVLSVKILWYGLLHLIWNIQQHEAAAKHQRWMLLRPIAWRQFKDTFNKDGRKLNFAVG